MFKDFTSSFKLTEQLSVVSDNALLSKIEPHCKGFTQFMSLYSGATFENGLYRIHRIQDILKWTDNVESFFPKYNGKIICFAYDWLGRHFVLNRSKTKNGNMLILLMEPGTGDALEIPVSFCDFHNIELVEYRNEALASEFYNEWIENGGTHPTHSQCIGYKVPLFLGGEDDIENLEVNDLDVYWSILGQLLNQVNIS